MSGALPRKGSPSVQAIRPFPVLGQNPQTLRALNCDMAVMAARKIRRAVPGGKMSFCPHDLWQHDPSQAPKICQSQLRKALLTLDAWARV